MSRHYNVSSKRSRFGVNVSTHDSLRYLTVMLRHQDLKYKRVFIWELKYKSTSICFQLFYLDFTTGRLAGVSPLWGCYCWWYSHHKTSKLYLNFRPSVVKPLWGCYYWQYSRATRQASKNTQRCKPGPNLGSSAWKHSIIISLPL